MVVAIAYWTEYLDCEVTREEDRRLEELMEEEYRRFEESVLGYSSAPPNFYDNF